MSEDSIPVSELARHVEFEEEVAALAWMYYVEEGYPEGRSQEHWFRAEAEVRRRHATPSGGAS
jgi:hypothetical protein